MLTILSLFHCDGLVDVCVVLGEMMSELSTFMASTAFKMSQSFFLKPCMCQQAQAGDGWYDQEALRWPTTSSSQQPLQCVQYSSLHFMFCHMMINISAFMMIIISLQYSHHLPLNNLYIQYSSLLSFVIRRSSYQYVTIIISAYDDNHIGLRRSSLQHCIIALATTISSLSTTFNYQIECTILGPP